jgi:hypothetical protein
LRLFSAPTDVAALCACDRPASMHAYHPGRRGRGPKGPERMLLTYRDRTAGPVRRGRQEAYASMIYRCTRGARSRTACCVCNLLRAHGFSTFQ